MNTFRIFLLILYEISFVKAQVTIPDLLKECYENNYTRTILPMNLRVLVDIIQKAEKDVYGKMDMRTLSSSLLHRFKFDGIQYIENMQIEDGILPFTASGLQRTKHMLMEELVPGNPSIFPSFALTLEERCTLHYAVSNTIAMHNFHNSDIKCQQTEQTERITGKRILVDSWSCPQEQGVILTQYGTVAIGAFIAAVAASLQRQSITIKKLLEVSTADSPDAIIAEADLLYNEDTGNPKLNKSQVVLNKFLWHNHLISSSVKLDNIWLSTIAGELAEIAVYQGPIVGPQMTLGATGYWNNTMRPSVYDLTSKHTMFDATRAEIIGDIDGFVIATNLQSWLDNFYNLRLSQILDMYYSHEGVSFDRNIKACNRGRTYLHVASKTILKEQTYAASEILAYRNSIAYMSAEALKRMASYATDVFTNYANDYLFTELLCQDKKYQPQVEAIFVFDGAWTRDYTMDFLAVLIEDLDVSLYGSKMGIIHGSTGEWLLNTTNSPSLAYHAISDLTKISWPDKLNFTKALETITIYLNESWRENELKHIIGNCGQAVIFLAPFGYLFDDEQNSTLAVLKELKSYHPDVHFLYYTTQYKAHTLKRFILQEEDRLIKSSNFNDIVRHLSEVPRILRTAKVPNLSVKDGNKDQFEEYISPWQTKTYRLHSHWKTNTKKITVMVHSVGYGTMKICSWSKNKISGTKKEFYCKELIDHNVVSLVDYSICTDKTFCRDTYYSVQNVSSLNKCAELDCRFPNQVRYIIRMQHVPYKNSTSRNVIKLLSLFHFVLLMIILRI